MLFVFFFFQAEDGIRDYKVTGVQTCALPIWPVIKYGNRPYLECSSNGDKRFSAFWACIESRGNKSIEELYQASKIFEDGSTGLSWREAKGRRAVNAEECARFYSKLWDE